MLVKRRPPLARLNAPRWRAIIRLSLALRGLRPGHWISGLASQLSLTANTLQQAELHNAVQNLAGRVIRKGVAEAARGADLVLGSAAERSGTAAANNCVPQRGSR